MMNGAFRRSPQQQQLLPTYTEVVIGDFAAAAESAAHDLTQSLPMKMETTKTSTTTTTTTTATEAAATALHLGTTGSLIAVTVALAGLFWIGASSSSYSLSVLPEQLVHFSRMNFASFAIFWSFTTTAIAFMIFFEMLIATGVIALSDDDDDDTVASQAAASEQEHQQSDSTNPYCLVLCILITLCTAYIVHDTAGHLLFRSVILTALTLTVFLLVMFVMNEVTLRGTEATLLGGLAHRSSNNSCTNDCRRNRGTHLPTFSLPRAAEKSRGIGMIMQLCPSKQK